MTSHSQHPADHATRARHGRGFWLLAGSFAVLMAYTTVPTPIYPTYQRHDGFPTVMVTVIFAAYGAGVMAGLYLAGHLSDHLGRRRMIAGAVALTLVSAALFALTPAVGALVVARVVSGVAIGMLTPAATAMLGELHRVRRPQDRSAFASTVATTVNTGGLALGPLVGGVLVQWAPAPMVLPYVVFLVLAAVAAIALAAVPETNPATPAEARPPYRPQRAVVRAGHEGAFRSAAVVAGSAFSVFGVLTSTTAVFLAKVLGQPSPLLSGGTIFLVMGASAVAQIALRIPDDRARVRLGLVLVLAGLAAIAAAAATRTLAPYLVGGVVAGAGVGLLFQSAVGVATRVSEPEHTGGTVAGIFLAAYAGISLPVVAVGLVTTRLAIPTTLELFTAVVALVILAGTLTMTRAREHRGDSPAR